MRSAPGSPRHSAITHEYRERNERRNIRSLDSEPFGRSWRTLLADPADYGGSCESQDRTDEAGFSRIVGVAPIQPALSCSAALKR
jgi:hypothetical protein